MIINRQFHSRLSAAVLGISLLGLLALPASADVITGKVTDFDSKAGLAGVKITAGGSSALSSSDGSYSLNTSVTAVGRHVEMAGLAWDGDLGAFRWDPSHGAVAIEVRGLRGELVDRFESRAAGQDRYFYRNSVDGIHAVTVRSAAGVFRFRMTRIGGVTLARGDGSAAPAGALAKAAALNNLTYSLGGYMNAVQQVNGGKEGLNVALKKGQLTSRKANLTWFESYPDPGSEECIEYNGCTWAGQFAALSGKQPESWVKANNILAVHSKDFNTYKLKTLRLTSGTKSIDAKVYDMCSDSDCNGCCTKNAGSAGFLIDVEKYTAERFGAKSGTIDWICLDC